MPREVNVFIDRPAKQGNNWHSDVRVEWVNHAGKRKEQSRTVTFPACLNWLTDDERAEIIGDIMLRCMRKYDKIDEE
jgi:hypothetical protein